MPGPARAHTEAELLAVALRLVDEGGPGGLSVRSVAAAVGVAPNAIYTYFPTKAALVAALADHLLARLAAPSDEPDVHGRSGRREVVELAEGLRDVLLAHPGAVPLLLGSTFDGPHALAAGERLLRALERAGASAADAARASYLLQIYVLGSVALDVAELDPTAARPDDATRTAQRREALAGVPAEVFPRTAAAADVVAAYNGDAQFRWGLARVLDGVLGPEDERI